MIYESIYLSRKVKQIQLGRDLWDRAGQGKEEVGYIAPDVEPHAHMWRCLCVGVITYFRIKILYLAMLYLFQLFSFL